ncbi:hypothetical protein QJQ45_004464 [Haematococcus lacustris]|nr:hypothetical protein QJQ45_004464 [Haematococcus lacustris]
MSALGLGGYGSEDDSGPDDLEQQRPIGQQGDLGLFGSYAAEERVGSQELAPLPASITSAPDVQDLPTASPAAGDLEHAMEGPLPDMAMQQAAGAKGAAMSDPLLLLPPELQQAPVGVCSEEVVAKLEAIKATSKRQQRSFIESLRTHRAYSNPDLLQQLVKSYNLQEAGTAFPPDLFDPTSLPKEDYKGTCIGTAQSLVHSLDLIVAVVTICTWLLSAAARAEPMSACCAVQDYARANILACLRTAADKLSQQLDRDQERRRAARAAAPVGQASIAFERGSGGVGAAMPNTHSGNDGRGSGPPGLSTSSALPGLNVAQLQEQVAKNAAAMMANAKQSGSRRSKWDSK